MGRQGRVRRRAELGCRLRGAGTWARSRGPGWYEAGGGIAVPIIIRPDPTWSRHAIGEHQALPKDAKAISKWPSSDDAWESVSEGLLRLLERLAKDRGLYLAH